MSSPGLASPSSSYIDVSVVRAAYRRALRTGKYWRLSPEERVLLKFSTKLTRVKSPILARALLPVICRIIPSLARRLRALELGLRVLEERVRQAFSLGYYKAVEWLRDLSLALQVGYSLLSTPRAYWPTGLG